MSNEFAHIGHVGKDDNNHYLKFIYIFLLNKTIPGIRERHKICNTFLMYSDRMPEQSFSSGLEYFCGCWSQIDDHSRNGMRKRAKIKLYVVRLKAGMN